MDALPTRNAAAVTAAPGQRLTYSRMKKSQLALVSAIDQPAEAGLDSLTGDMLAVAVAADGPNFALARLLRLATTEARALDPHAIIQCEADAVVALVAPPKLLSLTQQQELAEGFRQRVETAAGVGVSAGFRNVNALKHARQLGRACQLACVALATGRRVLGPGHTTDLRGLGERAIPALLNQTPALELFCDDLLEPLIDYDARRGGHLILTLETYFANRQQPFPTASQLGVHRNTIRYHFEVIERLTGRSLSNPDDAFIFWLSLKARSAAHSG